MTVIINLARDRDIDIILFGYYPYGPLQSCCIGQKLCTRKKGRVKAVFQSSHAAHCECLHLIKMNCLAL
jgi:hypothetical protein